MNVTQINKSITNIHYTLSYLLDVFLQAIWQELASLQDPDLCELAKFLPVVVLRSKASTVRKYNGAFLHWKQWAQKKFVYCLPVHYM